MPGLPSYPLMNSISSLFLAYWTRSRHSIAGSPIAPSLQNKDSNANKSSFFTFLSLHYIFATVNHLYLSTGFRTYTISEGRGVYISLLLTDGQIDHSLSLLPRLGNLLCSSIQTLQCLLLATRDARGISRHDIIFELSSFLLVYFCNTHEFPLCEYSDGYHRDMQRGKGACYLLPVFLLLLYKYSDSTSNPNKHSTHVDHLERTADKKKKAGDRVVAVLYLFLSFKAVL